MPSTPASPTRRSVLGSAALAAGALAGCITISSGSDETTYVLSVTDVGTDFGDAFRWEPSRLHEADDLALLERLLDEGSLVTEGFTLHYPTSEYPAYTERDGTYYRIDVDRGSDVERERWELWFELLDGSPGDDATVVGYEGMTDGLSEPDEYALETAFPLSEWGPRDVSDDSPGSRGHLFVRRDPDETELLPDPPFSHVRLEWGDDEHFLRVHTERVTVSLEQFEHGAESIADTEDAFEDSLEDNHLQATFDDLDDEEREILFGNGSGDTQVAERSDNGDRVVRLGRRTYEEEAPISDAFERVLERLGLDDVEVPEPKRVDFSEDVYFARDDRYYEAQLEIRN